MRGTYWNKFSVEVEYIPIQLNVKYVLDPTQYLYLSFGGGLSYIFSEIHYTIDRYFIGVSGAYQITEDVDVESEDDEGAKNFNNFRVGGKTGFYF